MSPFVAALPDFTSHRQAYIVAACVPVALFVAGRVPIVGRLVSLALMLGLGLLLVTLVDQRAGLDPSLARLGGLLHPDEQAVVGSETRVPMARDGHFWVRASLDGVKRRMLVDSGATATTLSERTARAAGLRLRDGPFPVLLQTANGTIAARTATVPQLRVGNIVARDVTVVVAPAMGDMDVIGMNFLSRLKEWRVEDGTLILTPHHPQAERRAVPAEA